jgi:hypothetical protein
MQLAFARTKIALNASITQAMPPLPASHTGLDDLTIGSTHLLIIACHEQRRQRRRRLHPTN